MSSLKTACMIVRQHLWGFNNGRIDDHLRQEIEIHLELCPPCKEMSDKEDYDVEPLG